MDRSGNRGGGVCCLYKRAFLVNEVALPSCLNSDVLCFECFDTALHIQFRAILIYRPPNSNQDEDTNLVDALTGLCVLNDRCILLGDFNIDVDWNNFTPNTPASRKFVEFFKGNMMTQHVFNPTRGLSVLDLILTTDRNLIKNVSVCPPFASSDHNCIFFDVDISIQRLRDIPLPNFNRADYKALSAHLLTIDWWSVFFGYVSVDDLYRRFCTVIYNALALYVPVDYAQPKAVKYPSHIQNLMSQKTRLFNQIVKFHGTPLSSSHYKGICSELDRHLKKFLAYLQKKASRSRNSKKLFSLMKSKFKHLGCLPVLLDEHGNQYLFDQHKAEALASHFSSIFTSGLHTYTATDRMAFAESDVCTDMTIEPTTVLRTLKSLKPSTSIPFDGIPQIIFRRCAHALYKPVAMILNISLMYGEVPSAWKESIVTAIPKPHAPPSLLSSYRPISITPTPSKVLEKFVRDEIFSWLSQNRLIPCEQHGFLPGASTVTQLADCVFDWSMAINEGNSVDVIYFDLSKAFDRVNHQKLLLKLQELGLKSLLINWIQSYLLNRSMYVKVGNTFSESYPCLSGVPQGGVLSPLLFMIYTMDLPACLTTHDRVKVRMYADDIKVYGVYNEHTQFLVRQALAQSIMNMMDWAKSWDIPVNLDKTVVLHFGTPTDFVYHYDGFTLKTVKEVRDLGVLINHELNSKSHVDQMIRKAFAITYNIFRNIESTEPSIYLKLYKAYVIPLLEYASPIWSPHRKKLQVKIEKVQRTFTRIMMYRCNPDPNYPRSLPSYSDRLELFNLKSLLYRRVFNDIVFCFKLLRGDLKLKPSKYWRFRPCRGRNSAVSLENPAISRICYAKVFNSLFFRGARWLQQLPADLLQEEKLSCFKAKLRRLNLLQILNIPDF